jgi:DNA-binding transcriptional LysR family regulator
MNLVYLMASSPIMPDTPAILARLKTRQLLLLAALEDSGSIRQAAARLRIAQPAASKLLQELELAVGQKLFERHRRGMRANIFGAIMIQHARLVLADFENARHEIAALAAGASGLLRLGGVISAIPVLIARAVVRLKRRLPALEISIDVNTSDVLVPRLLQGALDVLIARPLPLRARDELIYEPLIEEPLTVVCRPGHALSGVAKVALADLACWTWTLLPAGSPMRRVLAPVFAEITRDRPIDVVETSSMLTMAAMLQESDMLAVMPEDVAAYHIERGLLARVGIALPPVMGAYGIVTRRDRPASPAVRAFLDDLREVLAARGG